MTAKVEGWVWVEGLNEVQRQNLRRELTIYPKKTTDIASVPTPDPILLYRERAHAIGIPRGYWMRHRSMAHLELVHTSVFVPMASLHSRWTAAGPFAEQKDIVETLIRFAQDRPYWGGILEAGCGTGKSACGIEFAHRLGGKTLILVGQEFLLRQWKDYLTEQLPGVRVGIIQQKKCQWQDVDFAIALLQSLARDDGDKYPAEMYHAFHTVISDECHHMSSQTFADILPRFTAPYRLGLSATLKRAAQDERVFLDHIGPIVYTATMQAMAPQLRIVRTPTSIKPIQRGWDKQQKKWKYEVNPSEFNSAQIISALAEDRARTQIIVEEALQAVQYGRKVMILSERLEHLRDMLTIIHQRNARISVGVYAGEWFVEHSEKRRKVKPDALLAAERCQILLTTKQMVAEGFNVPALDVLILATPVGDVEQIVGRVRRYCMPAPARCQHYCSWRAGQCQGKPLPIIVDILDPLVGKAMGKCKRRFGFYRSIRMKIPQ